MSDEIADFDLSPKKVLAALEDIANEVKTLAAKMEESLGKQVPKSMAKAEEAAENGTNKIQKFFRNLGQRVKEDLKTAFDVASLAGGLKMGSEFAAGTKQVFEMERAFDRLNTRLKLTGRQLADFKKELGRKVAATGQKLEDVLPGVETAVARGGVKSPEQLEQIGDVLAKVKATTNEGTEGLSEKVVEILKSQGKKVTAQSFKDTVDALQGTRATGAFKTATDAGGAVGELAAYSKGKYSTRELGGLAAQASKAGPAGQDILRQLMDKGTTIGGQQQLNAVLGQQVFKNGKLDAGALGKVDQKRFGQYSQQTLEHATGLTGANGADLSRFLDSFKGSLGQMQTVVTGANETGAQFDIATDNLASKMDRFKEKTKEAGREIIGGLSKLGGDLAGGHFGNVGGDIKDVGKSAFENRRVVEGAVAAGAVAALLAGSGARSLLSKIPGGGALGGLMGGEAAKAAGVQPVYVTNASQIGGGIGGNGIGSKLLGAAGKGLSLLQMIGGAAVAADVGVAIGEGLLSMFPKLGTFMADSGDKLRDDSDMRQGAAEQSQRAVGGFNERNGTQLTAEEYAKAVEDGTLKAYVAANKNKVTHYTNPSSVGGRGKGM